MFHRGGNNSGTETAAKCRFLHCKKSLFDLKENNAHFSGVMKAMEGGFEKITLPALIFKCLFLALLHSLAWRSVKKKQSGEQQVDGRGAED